MVNKTTAEHKKALGLPEEARIALGFRPQTWRGWRFWLRHWSPVSKWWPRWWRWP